MQKTNLSKGGDLNGIFDLQIWLSIAIRHRRILNRQRRRLSFSYLQETEFIEIRDSDNETVTIGYFDGKRFHWTKDKGEIEAWKSLSFVTSLLFGGTLQIRKKGGDLNVHLSTG